MAEADIKSPDKIPTREENFSDWYVETIRKADMADYTAIRGCMVIKPYGFAIWERLRDALDQRIKATGHVNAYFPLFVPESLLKAEAEHVEGFAPECAWVTHGGSEQLEERLAIRPTSEAIICSIYAKWVQSYRDLPILINQWANVVRWEKRTRLFLRTSEFLWQEGHTVHRTLEEAQEETLKMIEVYREFLETELAIPAVVGQKSDAERFAGAEKTYTVEALMQDGLALQSGTSHNLGQHFAKGFGIKFLDTDNTEKFAWQTSWGVSTRLIGALVMTHGDDFGLKIPPRLAPFQVVFVPIYKSGLEGALNQRVGELADALKAVGVRTKEDLRDTQRPGFKYTEWELKGVPLRVELGPKDMEKGVVVCVRRDTREKTVVAQDQLVEFVKTTLDDIQRKMLAAALEFRERNTYAPKSFDEFCETLESKRGFLYCPWDGTAETETAIKEKTKATIRCVPFGRGECEPGEIDIYSGKPAVKRVLYARSY